MESKVDLSKKEAINNINTNSNSKKQMSNGVGNYESKYKKEWDATIAGIFILVVPFAIRFSGVLTYKDRVHLQESKMGLVFLVLVISLFVTIWVVSIAKRQNRDTLKWGIFSFFLAPIALIIIGQLKKVRLEINVDKNLPIEQQIHVLNELAIKLHSYKRYKECIEVLNNILQIDRENDGALKMRAISYFLSKQYEKAKTDFEVLKRGNKFLLEVNFYLDSIREAMEAHEEKFSSKILNFKKEKSKQDVGNILTSYLNLRGKYLLNQEELLKKLGEAKSYYGMGQYINGIAEIDKKETNVKLKSQIVQREFGFEMELSNTLFVEHNLGVSYTEITDISYNSSQDTVTFHLFDNTRICLTNDQRIKTYCNLFQQKTGIVPTALSSLK